MVILVVSPLGKQTGGIEELESIVVKVFGDEVMWWVAPLSMIQRLGVTGNKPLENSETEADAALA